MSTNIREVRKSFGMTQLQVSELTGVPLRTLKNWEAFEVNPNNPEAREPSTWAVKYVLKEIENFRKPKFKIKNLSVQNYSEICKKFSSDTSDWSGLDNYSFYTTSGAGWEETSDNAHGGVDVKWAFHLSDEEIEMRAAEELFEKLMDNIQLGIDEEYDFEQMQSIVDSFSL